MSLPYLDAALCALAFAPGGGVTLSLATDGETLYYDGPWTAICGAGCGPAGPISM